MTQIVLAHMTNGEGWILTGMYFLGVVSGVAGSWLAAASWRMRQLRRTQTDKQQLDTARD